MTRRYETPPIPGTPTRGQIIAIKAFWSLALTATIGGMGYAAVENGIQQQRRSDHSKVVEHHTVHETKGAELDPILGDLALQAPQRAEVAPLDYTATTIQPQIFLSQEAVL